MARISLSFLMMVCSLVMLAQERKLGQPNLPGTLLLDMGMNYLTEENQAWNRKAWSSKSVSLYYMNRYEISNKLSFHIGVGFGMEKFAFKGYHFLNAGDDYKIGLDSLPNVDWKKNKIAVNYLDVPMEFRFHPMGTENGEGFFVGIGAIAGLRMNSHTKLKYGVYSSMRKEKFHDGLFVQDYRFGVQARVGWRNFHFFYKQYMTEIFRKDLPGRNENDSPINPMHWTIGINFSGL
jgi:hypothetical protein